MITGQDEGDISRRVIISRYVPNVPDRFAYFGEYCHDLAKDYLWFIGDNSFGLVTGLKNPHAFGPDFLQNDFRAKEMLFNCSLDWVKVYFHDFDMSFENTSSEHICYLENFIRQNRNNIHLFASGRNPDGTGQKIVTFSTLPPPSELYNPYAPLSARLFD